MKKSASVYCERRKIRLHPMPALTPALPQSLYKSQGSADQRLIEKPYVRRHPIPQSMFVAISGLDRTLLGDQHRKSHINRSVLPVQTYQ
jgi:hypothetical protein